MARFVPRKAAAATIAFVILTQVALDFIEAPPLVTTVAFVSCSIRRLVIIPSRVFVDVVARRIIFPPVSVFGRRIDLLRDSFARQAADDGPRNSSRRCSDRSRYAAGRGARSCTARGCSDASPDRMRAWLSADWIAIVIAWFFFCRSSFTFLFIHNLLSRCEEPSHLRGCLQGRVSPPNGHLDTVSAGCVV